MAYILWRRGERGIRETDNLRSYRFLPAKTKVDIHYDQVIEALNLGATVKHFKEVGTITQNLFGWVLQNPQLREILDESYKMYDYHTRRIDGKSNLGWCRTMYHSIIQTIMRTDLAYYTMYVLLRKQYKLISYPYYTKFTKPGDRTYFRHIDLNIAQAVHSQQGVAMIQGSVSWDDEDDKNCTEMLDGFHNYLEEY